MVEQYKRKPNTVCAICEKAIYRRPSVIKLNKNKVFCSQQCFGISCRKEVPCIVCGKPILSGLNKRTCNRSCSNIQRIGIKYKIGRPRDNAKHERALKIKILLERTKVCERCGYDKAEILQIHHKNRDRNDNNMSNLELICPNCHCEEHYLQKSWLKNKPVDTL